MAPSLLIFFEKMPSNKVGKNDDAARPKANATVLAIKADGGLIPKYAATTKDPKEARNPCLFHSFQSFGPWRLETTLSDDYRGNSIPTFIAFDLFKLSGFAAKSLV